jgi:predicted TIM-barrel fold metal-dependent hydrolase
VESIPLADILREAREMRRVAGACAHQFFWLSGRFYDADRELKVLDTGLYEGLKLHELETPWTGARRRDLERVLAIAAERRLPVQFHCGPEPCSPRALAKIAAKFPSVNFDFAHCVPMDEMAVVMSDLPNVWTDVAWLADEEWARIGDYDWHGRLLFGSDFPAYHAKKRGTFTGLYRKTLEEFRERIGESTAAFESFLNNN